MANQKQIFTLDNTIEATNGETNGSIRIVDANGASLPASGLPTLPTTNGNYVLTVTGGVYTWSAETP